MDRILHSISTLWIYARREKYIDALAAEDAELAMREQEEENSSLLNQIRHRRAAIAEEMRGLAAPLSWRSLVIEAKPESNEPAVAVMPAAARAKDDFIQAA